MAPVVLWDSKTSRRLCDIFLPEMRGCLQRSQQRTNCGYISVRPPAYILNHYCDCIPLLFISPAGLSRYGTLVRSFLVQNGALRTFNIDHVQPDNGCCVYFSGWSTRFGSQPPSATCLESNEPQLMLSRKHAQARMRDPNHRTLLLWSRQQCLSSRVLRTSSRLILLLLLPLLHAPKTVPCGLDLSPWYSELLHGVSARAL